MHRHHALIGAALAQEELYEEAKEELLLALEGYRDPLLYNNLGHVLSKRGEWGEATRIYRAWADTGIDHPNALENLATAYERAGNTRRAARTLANKVSLWPQNSYKLATRAATLYLMSGCPSEALDFITAYEADPALVGSQTPAEYDNVAGSVFLATGDATSARLRFESALSTDPKLRSAKRNLESLYQEPGDLLRD